MLSLATERVPAPAPVRLLWRTVAPWGPREIAIFDVRGRRVRAVNLEPERQGAWTWDGRDQGGHAAAPGLYFARLREGGPSAHARTVLIP